LLDCFGSAGIDATCRQLPSGVALEPDAGDACTRTKKELGRMGSANVVACPASAWAVNLI